MDFRDRGLRAGDTDRDAALERLGDAFADGRLDFEEFHRRHDLALVARTLGDLDRLVRDLPRSSSAATGDELRLMAGLNRQRRVGHWDVPPRLVVAAAVADVRLDFRHALCSHRQVELVVRPGLGRVSLVVPADWGVRVDGLRTGWGSIRNAHPGTPARGRPLLVVTGSLGVGRLVVRRPRFFVR